MTQSERVLRALRAVGPRGITQADFSGLHGTPDNGPPITRVAARIVDLKERGCVIEAAGKRNNSKVYVLKHEPGRLVDNRPPDDRLFTPPAANAVIAA